jgi:hypothetical protein
VREWACALAEKANGGRRVRASEKTKPRSQAAEHAAQTEPEGQKPPDKRKAKRLRGEASGARAAATAALTTDVDVEQSPSGRSGRRRTPKNPHSRPATHRHLHQRPGPHSCCGEGSPRNLGRGPRSKAGMMDTSPPHAAAWAGDWPQRVTPTGARDLIQRVEHRHLSFPHPTS